MARPISGEIKEYEVKIKRPNNGYYVYRRRERYENGRMRKVEKDVLLGKILPNDPTQTIIPTRPKRAHQATNGSVPQSNTDGSKIVFSASRKHVGSSRILDCIAKKTGIEEDIYGNLDEGTAQKLISCARFLACTDGECLSHIGTWQLMHPIPYAEGLSKDICHRLTEALGRNETFRQQLFAARLSRQKEGLIVVAYDATTVSTYSKNQAEARYGFNKDADGLKTIKILALYASESREPLSFAKQPGNIPDVVSVKNALAELSVLTTLHILLVTDNGFYSEANAYELIMDDFSFLMRIEITTKWVQKILDGTLEELNESTCACSEDGFVTGITKGSIHTFEMKDSNGNVKTVRKKVYLHFYLDQNKHDDKKASLVLELTGITDLLNAGMPVEKLSDNAQKLVEKYIRFEKRRGKNVPVVDNKKVIEDCLYEGIFAVVGYGNHIEVKDTRRAFRTYINREHIEDHFRAEKQSVDGNTIRSWYGDNYMGRLIIQFVGLIYEDCLWNEVRRIKAELEIAIKNSKITGKNKTLAGKQYKLLTWLNKMSLHDLLAWFDAIEETEVSSTIKMHRWSTETLERDHMFLTMLDPEYDFYT